MWRVQTGDDPEAFARLVTRWETVIWDLCTRMVGDTHRGQDLKQEAFARVFLRRKQYPPHIKFSTWLWRIAVNLCQDELRRLHRRGECPLPGEDDEVAGRLTPVAPEISPDTEAAAHEEGEMVRQALLQLPEIYRTPVVLRHYEGLKLREIAAVLDVPEGTVHSRLAEAYRRLTRLLRPQFSDLRSDKTSTKPLTVFSL